MQGLKDKQRCNELIKRFQFDPKTPIRKMSKGMKQKVGIVVTFMHSPEVYILDEPTSGLDPLMQKVFIDLVLEEKEKGKTFIMSSHSFSEIERTCDRAAIIKDGRIVTVKNINDLQSIQRKIYDITFQHKEDVEKIKTSNLTIVNTNENMVRIVVQGDYNELIGELSKFNVINISSVSQSLEDVFMNYYDAKEVVK
jgi:ABC-2 type transport system ATP-binding protein